MRAFIKRSRFIDGPETFGQAFKVSHETIHRLEVYGSLLEHWQKTTNLVANSTLPELWHRHFADSAQLKMLAQDARLWLDLGSGAGFPGLVLAIINSGNPGFHMHLVESNQKKCAFLANVARKTKAPVDIHATRIELFAQKAQSLRPDVVSARALAPLPQLLELAEPFLQGKTRGLFLKGRDANAEIRAAQKLWTFEHVCHPSLTDKDGRIIEIAHLARRPQ